MQLPYGKVKGHDEVILGSHVNVWRGIPYARAERWQDPVEPTSLSPLIDGIYHADVDGPAPYQLPVNGNTPGIPPEDQSEDCQNLNVFSNCEQGDNCDVMLWLYPGSQVSGSASFIHIHRLMGLAALDADVDHRFAKFRKLVIVTINYRLGILNSYTSPALDARDPNGSSGQYGIRDQIAALRWIKKYIRKFGGNKDSVTIYGQSSGGTSIYALEASPSAAGLYHAAYAFSGSPNVTMSRKDAQHQHKVRIIAFTPCNNDTDQNAQLSCLLAIDPAELTGYMKNALTDSAFDFSYEGYPLTARSDPRPLDLSGSVVLGGPVERNIFEALLNPDRDSALIGAVEECETDWVPGFDQYWSTNETILHDQWVNYFSPKWGPGTGQRLYDLFAEFEPRKKYCYYFSMSAFGEGIQKLQELCAIGNPNRACYYLKGNEDPSEIIPTLLDFFPEIYGGGAKYGTHTWTSIMLTLEEDTFPFTGFANGPIVLTPSNKLLGREARLILRVLMRYHDLKKIGAKRINEVSGFPQHHQTIVLEGESFTNVQDFDKEILDTYRSVGFNASTTWITNALKKLRHSLMSLPSNDPMLPRLRHAENVLVEELKRRMLSKL